MLIPVNNDALKLIKEKHNIEDPFFDDGYYERLKYDDLAVFKRDDDETFSPLHKIECTIISCRETFGLIQELLNHFNAVHKNKCSVCRKSFPTFKILDIHILENHDNYFKTLSLKQKMYKCLVDECNKVFWRNSDRMKHLVDSHHFPTNFHFDNNKNKPKSTIACRYYNTKSGCKLGDKCKYLHKKLENPVAPASVDDSAMEIDDLCDKLENISIPKKISFGRKRISGFSKKQS